MAALRREPIASVAGIAVQAVEDFETGIRKNADGSEEKLTLPKSNLVRLLLGDGVWLVARPSGTEPKLKLYIGGRGDTETAVDAQLNALFADMDAKLRSYLFD